MTTASPRSPDAMSVDDLLAHIAGDYQDAHRHKLPELAELARKVERMHARLPEVPAGLADALEQLDLELDMHMEVEGAVLFPAMRANIHEPIAYPIAMMRREHESLAAGLDRIAELTHGFAAPTAACGSWQRLYLGLAELCATLKDQIRLEDESLFPRFDVGQARCACAHS